MVAKLCKYCNVQMLEGFDEVERKFYEQGTQIHHTRERCEALKNSGKPGAGHITAAGAGIEQWAAIGTMLDGMKKQLDEIESKVNQALAKIEGQQTLESEGSE